jgi:hypothetical protein
LENLIIPFVAIVSTEIPYIDSSTYITDLEGHLEITLNMHAIELKSSGAAS